MSKAAQFEAEANLAQPNAQYAQAQYYAPHPGYGQQQVHLQAYPPSANVLLIGQVPPAPRGWKDPGCCTICWSIFLLIICLSGMMSGIYSMNVIRVTTASLEDCDPSLDWCRPDKVSAAMSLMGTAAGIARSSLGSNGLQAVLLIAVIVFYCKRVTSPAARAWNYACWIILAILQAGSVLLMFVISLAITGGSVIMASIINVYDNKVVDKSTAAINTILSVLTIVFWVLTVLSTIPMIVSSVVAHKNRAPCSCSSRADYLD